MEIFSSRLLAGALVSLALLFGFSLATLGTPAHAADVAINTGCAKLASVTTKRLQGGEWRSLRYTDRRSELLPQGCAEPSSPGKVQHGLTCTSPLRLMVQHLDSTNRWRSKWLKMRVKFLLSSACAAHEPRTAKNMRLSTGATMSCSTRLRLRLRNVATGTDEWVKGTGSELFPRYCGGGAAPAPSARCADGQDNDGDGLIDLEDPGCSSLDDDSEADPPPPPGGDDGSNPPPPDGGSAADGDYFVRKDGAPPSQCNGRYDRPASGNKPNCAWSNPLHALNPVRIPRDSTLFVHGGTYEIGYGVPELETCNANLRRNCGSGKIPAGVTITGDCSAIPKLVGVEGVGGMINLQNSHNVTLRCLEITDRAECVMGGNSLIPARKKCKTSSKPYGPWARDGIVASDSSNVELDRVNVHGLATVCIRAGAIRNWRIKRSRFVGCGLVGWDGDLPGRTNDSNSGTIHFSDSEISWNGCIESLNGNSYSGCFAQKLGGYGDGLGTAPTRGHWIFERVRVEYNTSDGLDLLYLNRNGIGGSFEVRDSWLAHNAGSQLKTHAGGTVENNVIVGNCGYHKDAADMRSGDLCRGGGYALSISGLHYNNDEVVVVNNTLAGHGDCLTITPTPGGTVRYIDNILRGGPKFKGTGQVCGHFCSQSACDGINLQFNGNVFWKLRNNQCQGTGRICADPLLRDARLNTFDPALRSGSPATGKGFQDG